MDRTAGGRDAPPPPDRTHCCCLPGCTSMDPLYRNCADCLDSLHPLLDNLTAALWCLASPLAFPLIFCFPRGGDEGENANQQPWLLPMSQAPLSRPATCCLHCLLPCCSQFHLRHKLLQGDMAQYTPCQGHHGAGGPLHGSASRCPRFCLALETSLGCCGLCAFDASRRHMKGRHGYAEDPDEARLRRCQESLEDCCCCPGAAGNDDGGNGRGRCARSCQRTGRSCARGVWGVKWMGMGCWTTQMMYELDHGKLWETTSRGEDAESEDGFEDEYYNHAYLKGTTTKGGAVVQSRGVPLFGETMDRGARLVPDKSHTSNNNSNSSQTQRQIQQQPIHSTIQMTPVPVRGENSTNGGEDGDVFDSKMGRSKTRIKTAVETSMEESSSRNDDFDEHMDDSEAAAMLEKKRKTKKKKKHDGDFRSSWRSEASSKGGSATSIDDSSRSKKKKKKKRSSRSLLMQLEVEVESLRALKKKNSLVGSESESSLLLG